MATNLSNTAWSQSGSVELDQDVDEEPEDVDEEVADVDENEQTETDTIEEVEEVEETTESYDPFSWIFDADGNHRLEKLLDAQQLTEEMPETISTFYPSDRLDWWTGEDHERAILQFVGYWMLPDRFQQGEVSRWVNPGNKWSDKYSDVASTCPCGAVIYTTDNRGSSHGYSHDHDDDCRPQDTLATKIDVWDNREEIIREAAQNCLGYSYIYEDRLGTSKKALRRFEDHLGISFTELKKDGYRQLRATLIELNEDYEISGQKLATAFGMSDGTVYKHINGEQSYYE